MSRRTRPTHRVGRAIGGGVAAAVLVLTPASAALAREGRGDVSASFDDQRVVELTTEGATKARAGLAFHHTRADLVTATNAAVAYTSCDGCRAVALSFQVVVADGAPTSLDVGNLALAMNENCTGCESVAVAFQVVLASDRRLTLTATGRRELADLRTQLRELARSELAVTEIESQAQSLMAGVANVLSSELKVRAKVRCDKDIERRPGRLDRPDHREHLDPTPSPDTDATSPAADQEDPAGLN